jgi:hypothetical protein
MPVFKVDRNFKIILNPDAAKLCPELTSLTNDELLFVILAIDYCDGPYRKRPAEERRSLALKRVFKDNAVNLETKRMQDAMEAYKSLVFDIRRETLDVLKQKAQLYHKELLNPTLEFKRMKELDQALQYIEERIDKIDTSLTVDDINEMELKGQKKLSHLEVWQRRQKEFRKFRETT